MKDYLLLVAMLVLMVCVAGCNGNAEVVKPEPIRPVRIFTAKDSTSLNSRTYPGKVKATKEAALAFRISGQVVELKVKEGDYVKKGQLVAMLDRRDYLAAVADLEAQLAGARAVLKQAKLNIERNRKLIEGKIISQSAFDSAQSNFETSQASVLSLEQTLQRAKLNLQYTKLKAPFSGLIAKKYTSNHEYIQAKEVIADLEDNSALDIVVDLPESVWVRAFSRKTANLPRMHASFESLPGRTFPLTLKEYQTNADPGTQTYEITLSMDNTEGYGVHPGMTAEISGKLPDRVKQNSVIIPYCAVSGPARGKKFVWIIDDDNAVYRREVEIGRIAATGMTQVLSGVNPGEKLVTAGVHYLQEGQVVKVLEGRIGVRQ